MRWGMLRGAGIRSGDDGGRRRRLAGDRASGPGRRPCRVVYVVDEPDRRGFAYGTLPGHPESGEELFLVRYDPDTENVYAEVKPFPSMRPGGAGWPHPSRP